MVGATRVSDAGTRRASTAAGTASRFGISGSNSHSLAAKRAAEQLAASRREALELRTRLERAERRNADLELSRGEGARREPAERSPVGTTEKFNHDARLTNVASDYDAKTSTATETPPAALLELARAHRRIEDLRNENDELRRFARSVAGADPESRDAERSDADADADDVSRFFIRGGGAAATAREARRLEAVVSATTRGIDRGDDAEDMDDDDENDENAPPNHVSNIDGDDDGVASRPSTEETALLRRALAALRAELRTQAHARAILEEERDAFVKRIAEKEEAVRQSAAREAASAASLRAARQDALAAAALGEELARSCAEKLERAEAVARAWEQEARRLGKIERENAERRVLAAAIKAEAAAVESRTENNERSSFTSPRGDKGRETDDVKNDVASASRAWRAPPPSSPPPSAPSEKKRLWASPLPASPSPSRDSPFADSGIFADASAGKPARVPPSPPSVSDKRATRPTSVVAAVAARGVENQDEAVPSTPGEALAASLRRQSATLDALRGARSKRDEELRRVRDRLDRLVASPRRVGYVRGKVAPSPRRYQSSSPSSFRHLGFSNNKYDRYADPSPDPSTCRRLEEEAKEAYERAQRDTRRAEFLAKGATSAEKRFVNGRAVPTHPSRVSTFSAEAEESGEKKEKKSLFSMPSMSMPSMPSFGTPLAAMNKAASTIQSAWRRKKKT